MINTNNFTSWAKELHEMYKARVCNTFILSGNVGDYAFEFNNLTNYLTKLCQDTNCLGFDAVVCYDSAFGGHYLYSKKPGRETKLSFAEFCNKIENSDAAEKVAYIIKYPQSTIPNCSFANMKYEQEGNCIRLHRAINSRKFFRQQSLLIIIAESVQDVNPMFVSSNIKSTNIEIGLPTAEERKLFIRLSIEKAQKRPGGYVANVDIDEFVRLTAGLTRLSIEDLILQSSSYRPLTKSSILKKKEELIQNEYSNIIEILDASNLSLNDFAGQERVKAYFKEVVIDAIAKNNNNIIPKGVLLMGPPGTGKSYFARCLAGSAGINFVEFKMSKILDKYVGEAEKNLEKAFAVFRALAPVGVFIDELDQALSRGEHDSNSVNKNLFGMFLAELSKPENRGKIIWLGATNYPNKIDEALKRTGRFDKKIPFFAPTTTERRSVFKKRIEKTGAADANIDYALLASKTEGFTQAEIEGIVVKSYELAIRRGSRRISNNDLMLALEYMSATANFKIQEMENLALLECNDIEFLSDTYRKKKIELEKSRKSY